MSPFKIAPSRLPWRSLGLALLSLAFVLLLWVFLLLTALRFWCFHRDYYAQSYVKLHTAERMGIKEEELEAATTLLLDYLNDRRQDLQLDLQRGSRREPFFGLREQAHMVDVKRLYQQALSWQLGSGLALLPLTAVLFYTRWRRRGRPSRAHSWGLSFALGLLVLGFGAVLVYALLDFEKFWTSFHELFFDNDLWLLDPSRERLIQMVPEPFFSGLALRIALSFMLSFSLVLGLMSRIYRVLAAPSWREPVFRKEES